MQGKKVIVTGATNGIGRAAAAELVRRGATVGIVGRDRARTEAAAEELGAAEVFLADLSELDQVRTVAADIADRWPAVDVLVNNAGINAGGDARTSDGFDPMVATNLLAPFLLTRLLLGPLRAAAPSRVVNVASEAHRFAGRLDPTPEGLAALGRARGAVAQNRLYGLTKLGLLLLTDELAERTRDDRIDVNACCPGLVATNLAGDGSAFTHASKFLSRTPLVRRPEQGAAVLVRLAADPARTGTTGTFTSSTPGGGLVPGDRRRRDAGLRRRLWTAASQAVGLD